MTVTPAARPVLPEETIVSRRIDVLVDQETRLREAIAALGPGAVESPFIAPVLAHCLVVICNLRHLRGHVEAEWHL